MSIAPDHPEGYVYYIRLKTKKGILYKVGFTKMESVDARFSYGGSETHKMIDKVLMYKYCMHGYNMEQKIHYLLQNHKAFHKYSLKNIFRDLSKYPLFKDGQSELYKTDVLGLDPNPPFRLFGSSKSNLVEKRKLYRTKYYDATAEAIQEIEERDYMILDSFLREPLLESKEEFTKKNGMEIVSLIRWGIKYSVTSFEHETTVHGAKPMPSNKDDLLKLKVLKPKWGFVESIPKDIGHLTNLETIKFSQHGIKSIPEGLYNLPKLRVLDLSGTEINIISEDIQKLKTLENFDVSNTLITKVPFEICQLSNLRELNLSYSKITEVPSDIRLLENLETLDLSYNTYLNHLPYEIASLNKLKRLNVDAKHWKFLYELGMKKNIFIEECSNECQEIEQKILLKYSFVKSNEPDSVLSKYSCPEYPYFKVVRTTVEYLKKGESDFCNLELDAYVDICFKYVVFCSTNNWTSFLDKLAEVGAEIDILKTPFEQHTTFYDANTTVDSIGLERGKPYDLFFNEYDEKDVEIELYNIFLDQCEATAPDDLWNRTESDLPADYWENLDK